jgi:hypothetical protein
MDDRERTSMPDQKKVKSRRDFIKDGMRAVVLGGFVFSGLFLGWRGRANSGTEVSCSIDLPCRRCSKISRCKESQALRERKKMSKSRCLK